MKTKNYYSNNFITCELRGRTGNIMFEIAHAFAKSLEFNRQLILPQIDYLRDNILRNFDMVNFRCENFDLIEYPFHFEKSTTPSLIKPTMYRGYYQSEKYFGNYKNVIKSFYSPTEEFIIRAKNDFPFLDNNTVAALNVRRGDYLTQPTRHPVITVEYINEAYKHLPKHDVLLVVSDDIEWCKENIKLPNVVFNEKYWDYDALWLLSLCNYFIISNSTFSWWGAWLSNYNHKVVIAPGTWFGPDIDSNTISDDIYCEGWIKIPTKFQDGFIVPSYEI
jgi:hypothetical protein